MQVAEKTPWVLEQLQQTPDLQGISPATLQWLIDQSELWHFEQGERMFQPGEPVEHMYILLQGEVAIRFEQNGEYREVIRIRPGQISGVLPYSRMSTVRGIGDALTDLKVLTLHKDRFGQIEQVDPELMQRLVSVMTSRVRDFTQRRTLDEKLMALGKLSAGLAHELNNPASAMVRSADELYKSMHMTPGRFKSVITMRISPEQTDQINDILFSRLENYGQSRLTLMEREEKKDELLDWMADHQMEDAEEVADTFVDFGMTPEDLDRIGEILEDKDIAPILWWLESTMNLERLVTEIRTSADRIAQLVKSIKVYTHMDRGADRQPTDIHEGLRSTLTMLQHKLKKKQIAVREEWDMNLPAIPAQAGQLNQVWTNLIDNAIDAMTDGGQLSLRTFRDHHEIGVEITDTGSGIPEEIRNMIFDPFFTTKGVGEGTGMGLDIVRRIVEEHQGKIEVDSAPGKGTTFRLLFLLPSK